MKIIIHHKRAKFDYQILETMEAGMVLQGTEVKSLRNGKGQINESFISIDSKLEAWIINMKIPPYDFGNRANHDEARKRKLLLHRKEIDQLLHRTKAEGLTIIPLKVYFKDSKIKIQIGLAKGKKLYDKRQDQMKKDVEKKLRRGEY